MLERIGKYEIRPQIGRGAMGTVYEGFDPGIGRRVAIRMLRTEMFEPRQLPDILARFKREAQSAGRLSHPHIVTIHKFGEEQGTPAYMSPEQCRGLQVDHRSDLFSAGVILYQLLSGDKPFTGSVTTIIQKVLRQEPIAPSELNPTLSPAWDKVVARAMAKKPEARFETARQFAEAEEHVQRAAEERSRAETLRRAGDERREAQRLATMEAQARKDGEARAKRAADERTVAVEKPAPSRVPAIAAVILVVLGIAGATFYYRQGVEDQAAKAEAAREEAGQRSSL